MATDQQVENNADLTSTQKKKFDEFPVANKNFVSKLDFSKKDREMVQSIMDKYGARGHECKVNPFIKYI